MWKKIRQKIDLIRKATHLEKKHFIKCGNCDGTGTVPYASSQDDYDVDTCHICGGVGVFVDERIPNKLP